jgi:hypothetical protein
MKSPKNLSHKPIISVNDYDRIDGKYANKTDAMALSIGNAQYDEEEISLKVWRINSQENWSRQSEELPIHRNLDLSILFISALFTNIESHYSNSVIREEIDDPNKVKEIKDYFEENKTFLEPRLRELQRLLNDMFDKQKK